MKLESLKNEKFQKLSKSELLTVSGAGTKTGARGELTGKYVQGNGWEFMSWTSDEKRVYQDPDTGEITAYYFDRINCSSTYINF